LPWHKRPVSFFQLDPPTFTRERNDFLEPPFFAGVRRISSRKAAPEQEVRLFCGCAHVSCPCPANLAKGAEREDCIAKEQGERSPKWHFVSFLGSSVALSLTLSRAMRKRHHAPSCAAHSCVASFLPICYPYICFSGTIEKEWERCSKCLKQGSSREGAFLHASSRNDCATER
jgi:hypothetical protein